MTEGGTDEAGVFHKIPRIGDSQLAAIFGREVLADLVRKVYEVSPLVCPECGATMKVIAFLSDFSVVDRIINHLKLTFIAAKPPPARIVFQEVLIAAETGGEYFS